MYKNYIKDDIEKDLLVIFGGTGDLTYRKLVPAVYNLFNQVGEGKEPMRVLIIGRRDWTREEYIENVKPWVKQFSRLEYTEEKWNLFKDQLDYYKMDISNIEEYKGLFEYFDSHYSDYRMLFYYAVAPRFFDPITRGLGQKEWTEGRAKVIVEKPFGENLEDAKRLFKDMEVMFGRDYIYHIDHYLGKEMVQNITTLRFDNMIFRSCWNKDYIESVEISAREQVGVETRGGYYDKSGAMRDMVQNHLFQILSILAMEMPEKDSPYAVTVAQQNVLQAIKPMSKENLDKHLVMGQYSGYRSEDKVDPESKTETYAAMAVFIDNPRWEGVPFIIRTGKKLDKRETNVVINFKKANENQFANRLHFHIQPDEGVKLSFNIKTPGLSYDTQKVDMDFCQSCDVNAHANTPEAYERLIKAVSDGQHFLFSQWAQIEYSWKWVDEAVSLWKEAGSRICLYEPGTRGPKEADDMIESFGTHWYSSKEV